MKIINQQQQVQAVTYVTKDPAALAGFYQQALNIPVAKQLDKDHVGVQLENLYLGFDKARGKVKPGTGGAIVWFLEEDVEEAYRRIVALGAEVYSEVNKEERPGVALAVFYDPDGNLFGIIGPSVAGAVK